MERRFKNDRLPLLGREDKKTLLIGLLHYKGCHVLSQHDSPYNGSLAD